MRRHRAETAMWFAFQIGVMAAVALLWLWLSASPRFIFGPPLFAGFYRS